MGCGYQLFELTARKFDRAPKPVDLSRKVFAFDVSFEKLPFVSVQADGFADSCSTRHRDSIDRCLMSTITVNSFRYFVQT